MVLIEFPLQGRHQVGILGSHPALSHRNHDHGIALPSIIAASIVRADTVASEFATDESGYTLDFPGRVVVPAAVALFPLDPQDAGDAVDEDGVVVRTARRQLRGAAARPDCATARPPPS